MIISKIEAIHDRFCDNILSKIVEKSHKIMESRQLFDLISFLIDVYRLIFFIEILPILLVKPSKNIDDDINKFFQTDQIFPLNSTFNTLNLLLKSVPLENV